MKIKFLLCILFSFVVFSFIGVYAAPIAEVIEGSNVTEENRNMPQGDRPEIPQGEMSQGDIPAMPQGEMPPRGGRGDMGGGMPGGMPDGNMNQGRMDMHQDMSLTNRNSVMALLKDNFTPISAGVLLVLGFVFVIFYKRKEY